MTTSMETWFLTPVFSATTCADGVAQLQCDVCLTWQHMHCHGFLAEDDPRIPHKHACYDCLLQNEPNVFAEMSLLAIQRKALMRIWVEEYPKRKGQFARLLGELANPTVEVSPLIGLFRLFRNQR